MLHMWLEGQLHDEEYLLLFPRAPICFPAPTSGGSQLTGAPVLGDLTLSSVLQWRVPMCISAPTRTNK